MQITLPDDAFALARTQAAVAGFGDVSDYVASLIRDQATAKPDGDRQNVRAAAIESLRQLRRELPKLSPSEIVDDVRRSRADLP